MIVTVTLAASFVSTGLVLDCYLTARRCSVLSTLFSTSPLILLPVVGIIMAT